MMGECKLCGDEKKLCKQSHIIPNFMYKDLFDEKNRMYTFSGKKGVTRKTKVQQTGEFDKNILCKDCDNNRLGELERYASLILYDGFPKIVANRVQPDGMAYTYCAEIDYTKFKLFLLSILWRASISKRPMFREVNLGPHETLIHRMLLERDPGEQLNYPCLIMTYLNLKKLPSELVAQPSQSRVDGGIVYKFMIGGMIYIFFISKHIIPSWLADVAISPKDDMKIIHSTPNMAKKAIGSMLGIKSP